VVHVLAIRVRHVVNAFHRTIISRINACVTNSSLVNVVNEVGRIADVIFLRLNSSKRIHALRRRASMMLDAAHTGIARMFGSLVNVKERSLVNDVKRRFSIRVVDCA
jgi:hypothetical protein